MLTTLKQKVAHENAALITIDVQRDFWDPEAAPAKYHGRDVSGAKAIMQNLLDLVDAARREGLPIIHVRNEEPEWAMSDASKELRWRHKMRRQANLPNLDYALCQPGTPGAEFYLLEPAPHEIIITKHRYSGFIGTDLNLALRSLNRKSLIFCGGSTNICLESTVRDGFMLDYYCIVVDDCSASAWGEKAHKNALENIELGFGQVVSLQDVCTTWEEGRQRSG